jgi:DNA-directed RNA polymerase subunit RPC12/RpoP
MLLSDFIERGEHMTICRLARFVRRWLGFGRSRTASRPDMRIHGRDRFDKFTERARRVLQFAQEEAQRFQHNYIGTEHLLLGLIREGEGVAAKVLVESGIDLEKVRRAVEDIIGQGDRPVYGEVGLTPRAKKVVELAVDEARRLNHHYVGTEHLLLGLLREGEGIGAGVLESSGLKLEEVRASVLRVLNEQKRPMHVCSFCEKRRDQVQRLIAGPGPNVYVCDECVARLSLSADEPIEDRGLRCSFCGKKQRQVQWLATGPHGVNICNQCLILCQEIIAGE